MPKARTTTATPKPLPTRRDALATRLALLDASAKIFGRIGYRNANIREICAEAGVNMGAINRHFGSKKALYHEVVVRAGQLLFDQEPCPQLKDFDKPEDALRGWMRFHLRLVLLRQALNPVANALITRELSDPTDALDEFFELLVKPISASLSDIVKAVLGRKNTPQRVLVAANYVHGICAFQSTGSHILSRLDQPTPQNEKSIEHRLDQLFPMVLAGVKAVANNN